MRTARVFIISLLTLACATTGWADFSFTGSLQPDDPNSLFTVVFQLPSAQTVAIQSYGYGGSGNAPGGKNGAGNAILPGGFDTYLSLFTGSGPGATFLGSNDDFESSVCAPGPPDCRDSGGSFDLSGGTYTLVLSVFDNFSFAENLGTGTLGDGFIGLGSYEGQTSDYALDVSAPGLVVVSTPEPDALLLCALVILLVLSRESFRRRIACRR
jgi:hypothetical protein